MKRVTMRKTVIIITAAILLFILFWGFRYLTMKRNQRQFEALEQQYQDSSIPGQVEVYSIQEHGALELDDIGFGDVNIGYGETGWPVGTIAWKKEDKYLDLQFWTATADHKITSKVNSDMYISDEIEFGGYRIKVKDNYYLRTTPWKGTYFAFIEISLID